MSAVRVRPWEVQPGDRVLGTGLVVASWRRAPDAPMGGDVERQRYLVVLTDGRTLAYSGESWLSVIRG